VDETFDVSCVTSGRHLVSTYFWEEVQLCEEIASVVMSALNRQAEWHGFIPQKFEASWHSFRRRYSGPYDVGKGCCPGRGDYLDIYCRTTGESIIHSYGLDSESKLIANQIAKSLNSLHEETT